ncbi:Syntaxin-71 [Ancistrocladus abbreviatus]
MTSTILTNKETPTSPPVTPSLVSTRCRVRNRRRRPASVEKNRAAAGAMYAEIRRTKSRLFGELPKLQRLAVKKVRGLSKEELEARTDLVAALKDRIESVPDGTAGGSKPIGGWAASA